MAVAVLAQGGNTSATWHIMGMYLCCRYWCRGHGLALWLLHTLPAGIYTLGRWGMNCSELQEMLLNTKFEEKFIDKPSVQESRLYFSSTWFCVVKWYLRSSWDLGATYTKLVLHTVIKWWEWRTGRHSWKKLYQGALTGDYGLQHRMQKSARHAECLLGWLKSH